jgi:MoaA/NifB/PqqE/SkfB family radical SAM enzyme
MDPTVVDKLAAFLDRASTVVLFGYGESLMSPNFKTITDKVLERGPFNLTLYSNGSTLTRPRADYLLDIGLAYLTISLDGADEETVRHTRTASLKQILRNIDYLVGQKVKRGLSKPEIHINFTASQENVEQLPALVNLAADHSITDMSIALAKVFDSSLLGESLFHDSGKAARVFDETRSIGDRRGVNILFPPIGTKKEVCLQPFTSIFVKWNGDVRLCCSTAIVANPPLYIQVGNLYRDSLDELWNGATAVSCRAGFYDHRKINPICAKCPVMEYSIGNFTRLLENGDAA